MKNFLIIGIFYLISLSGICGVHTLDEDKPDLRDGTCVICRGNVSNYSILNVYFSDIDGNPRADICVGTGPYYISLLYTSNAKNDINNFRLIANILKKDRSTDAVLDDNYINEYSGTIPPCNDATCIVTILIPDLGFTCSNEYYELSRPLVAWTPSKSKELEDAYTCNDYPAAQCLNASNIPIEVGTLAYDFSPRLECFEDDINQTSVSFGITSLFGGNPTLEYEIDWEFLMPDGSIIPSTNLSETFYGIETGETVSAKLTISQGSLAGTVIEKDITVPPSLDLEDVIDQDASTTEDTDEGASNGLIDITFKDGDYFYFWTSVDDPDFYSEASRIEDLPEGTYVLTTYDLLSGLCRTDIFEVGVRILPVEFLDLSAKYENLQKLSHLIWATAKETSNSHFEIERSDKGINEFKKIGEVDGMGWKDTVTDYEFMDDNLPLYGGNMLYRIKQVDYDGNSTYSRVLSVITTGVETTSGVWRAFPNPILGDQLKISLLDRTQYNEEQLTFRIIHSYLTTQTFTVNSENELNDQLSPLISKVPKGILVVEIQWGQKVEHIKILKR